MLSCEVAPGDDQDAQGHPQRCTTRPGWSSAWALPVLGTTRYPASSPWGFPGFYLVVLGTGMWFQGSNQGPVLGEHSPLILVLTLGPILFIFSLMWSHVVSRVKPKTLHKSPSLDPVHTVLWDSPKQFSTKPSRLVVIARGCDCSAAQILCWLRPPGYPQTCLG